MSGPGNGVRRHAIVTGANSGIGEAIARRLATDGAQVLLVARNAGELERVAKDISAAGGVAHPMAIDLAGPEAATKIVDAAREKMGGVDMLVNCASLTRNEDFFTLTDDRWRDAFEIKVFAAIRLCRTAWPDLSRSHGSIVNICGIGARTPSPHTAITAASSSAMLAITKVLAHAGVGAGVQVNAINPGLIATPRIQNTIGGGGDDPAAVSEALERAAKAAGAVRAGRPEDVASLVAYIFSPAGEMLQGAIIDLDGGVTKGL